MPLWAGLTCRVCGVPLPDGGERCFHCRKGPRAFRLCRSAGLYEGVLKTCLWKLKYGGRAYLAGPVGDRMAETFAGTVEFREAAGLVPVPLHFWRERRRGYNQAVLLAERLSERTGRPLLNVLYRRRATPSQTALDREERFRNVADAFQTRRGADVRGKTLLLVDDVCTTGATLEACARALKAAGARRVYALTAARQV